MVLIPPRAGLEVFCLGTPSEGHPLVFQNYQHSFHAWPKGHAPETQTPTDCIKGGLLPGDVRNPEILLGPSYQSRMVNSDVVWYSHRRDDCIMKLSKLSELSARCVRVT